MQHKENSKHTHNNLWTLAFFEPAIFFFRCFTLFHFSFLGVGNWRCILQYENNKKKVNKLSVKSILSIPQKRTLEIENGEITLQSLINRRSYFSKRKNDKCWFSRGFRYHYQFSTYYLKI